MTEITEPDQPLTPAGRLFLQPLTDQVINCALICDHPIDVAALKSEVQNSLMLRHPRFCSLMVRHSSGLEFWRKTQVEVDRHFVIHQRRLSDGPSAADDDVVNDYVADLAVSSPLATDKPLWEVHLLLAHNTAVFRVHHALGDGISLMSMLVSCCRKLDDTSKPPEIVGNRASTATRRRWTVQTVVMLIWYTLIYAVELVLRAIWLRDSITAVSGGAGVELWPRRVATARFRIEDMKIVKRAVDKATINDVLFGVISRGLSKYLDIRSHKVLPNGLQLTGLAMVNLRPQAGLQDLSQLMNSESETRYGNRFGTILLPVCYHKGGSDPIEFLKRAKAMIDKKKLSLEAPFSYNIGELIMSFFGAKLASQLQYRIVCNTTFTISNIMGPREKITLAGNPVKNIRVSSSSLPHAITMHMVSYAGVADMQIQVAKEIIPEPKALAKCFEDALLELKEAAEIIIKNLEASASRTT